MKKLILEKRENSKKSYHALAGRSYSVESYKKALEHFSYDIEIKVSDYDNSAYIMSDYEKETRVYKYLQEQDLYIETLPTTNDNNEIFTAGKIEDYIHTKTGEKMELFKLTDKLSKDAFKGFRVWMKDNKNAYYSRYATGFILRKSM